MGTNAGYCEQIFALANHKKSLVTITAVNSVGSIVPGHAGIDAALVAARELAAILNCLAARGHSMRKKRTFVALQSARHMGITGFSPCQ